MGKTKNLFVIVVCEHPLTWGPNPLQNSKPQLAKRHQSLINADHNLLQPHVLMLSHPEDINLSHFLKSLGTILHGYVSRWHHVPITPATWWHVITSYITLMSCKIYELHMSSYHRASTCIYHLIGMCHVAFVPTQPRTLVLHSFRNSQGNTFGMMYPLVGPPTLTSWAFCWLLLCTCTNFMCIHFLICVSAEPKHVSDALSHLPLVVLRGTPFSGFVV